MAVSAMLLAATAVLWLRGHFTSDHWYYARALEDGTGTRWSQYMVNSGAGAIGFVEVQQSIPIKPSQFLQQRASQGAAGNRHYTGPSTQPGYQFVSRSFMGIAYGRMKFGGNPKGTDYGRELVAPLWELAAAWVILPVIWLVRWRSQRLKRLAGCCRVCGYDLRATPDRCPECGAIPTTAEGTAKVAPDLGARHSHPESQRRPEHELPDGGGGERQD
jgi:hypothetical protein